jgi:transposase InsO family protein
MHTDEGSEVINNWLKDWLKKENINHLISTTDTPQLNSFVERNNGKLVHQSNVMMQHSNSHKLLWQFAICYAVYVQNRTPHTGIE